jgi:nicotinate-nucleotide adenylyltransferase
VPGLLILGGAFDPVHLGHLALAEFARTESGAARVLFVPAGEAPLKEAAAATFAQRAALLRQALAGTDFELDEREGRRGGPSYTVDTLEELARETGEPLLLLAGADQLAQFRRWHRWERVLELAQLLVVNRPGWQTPADAVPHRALAWPGMELSATWLRARLAARRPCRHLLPPGVWERIVEEGLYR